MCRAAQENGVRTNVVSILTGTTKSGFSRICSSVIPYPNGTKFTMDPSSRFRDMSQQNFVEISSSFRTLCVNRYNSRIHASIWLKFGTRIGSLNTNNSFKFGINPINIPGVTSDFTNFTKFNFCQAYRLNRFDEQAENRYVARLNIRGVTVGS